MIAFAAISGYLMKPKEMEFYKCNVKRVTFIKYAMSQKCRERKKLDGYF